MGSFFCVPVVAVDRILFLKIVFSWLLMSACYREPVQPRYIRFFSMSFASPLVMIRPSLRSSDMCPVSLYCW